MMLPLTERRISRNQARLLHELAVDFASDGHGLVAVLVANDCRLAYADRIWTLYNPALSEGDIRDIEEAMAAQEAPDGP